MDNQKASEYAGDVLSAPFLTEDLWEQVLDIYKLHFAPELPFLHLPTMKEKLGRKLKSSQQDHDSDLNLVLLGVLTLTARHHTDLVKYLAHICNNQPGNARTRPVQTVLDPAAASEYYADILTMALGPLRTAMKVASVERVAALLMLGLYEWSQIGPKSGGLGAWMYVGVAIRMAQFLKLGFGDIPGPGDMDNKSAELQRRGSFQQSQVALDKEIRRRTMFSCFILDRMLSCGKERVSIVNAEDLQIQLPCSEDKFDLAMEVPTGFLRDRARHGMDDSVLSRFIQLVDIWGEISKYSSEGGRTSKREENHPPWTTESAFYQLDKRLEEFDAELPGTFTFSRSNYFKHENHQASSVFVLLHMLRCVCLIMLHREWIPFVPIRCEYPQGPLDHPIPPTAPDGFWISSAEQVFKASRDIIDLIEICQRKNKLPQSTIVLFAIWTASFCGLYAAHFPQMDIPKHMLNYDYENDDQDESVSDVLRRGSVAFAAATLHKMSKYQKMASTYVGILRQMDKYFDKIKQDYFRFNAKARNAGEVTLRVRDGGIGGGLEEYQRHDKKLKDFGFFHPEDHNNDDHSDRSSPNTIYHRPPTENSSSKSTQPGSFTAINRTPITPAPETGHLLNNGGYPTPHPEAVYAETWRHHSQQQQHQQQQQQQQLPPPQAYATSEAMLDPTTSIAVEANNQAFRDFVKKEESRRIGAIGDLGYFSSGDSQIAVADMPFGDSSYIPTLGDSSYYMQMGDF